jgi:hypothetical protein
MPLPMGEGLGESLNIGYACRNLQPKTFGRGFDSRRLHFASAPDLSRSGALFFSGKGLRCECLGNFAGEGNQRFVSASRSQERQADG